MSIDIRTLNLSKRLRDLVTLMTVEYRRFKQLEVSTGIQADTWKSWFHGRQRPTVEMIETVGKLWPQYAFWLITGYVDEKFGHVAPGEAGYPDRTVEQKNSTEYFQAISNSYAEARNVAEWMLRDGYEDEEIDPTWPIYDVFLRGALQMDLPGEITKRLLELKKIEKKAEALRRAEILLNLDLPTMNQTELEGAQEKLEETLESLRAKIQYLKNRRTDTSDDK